MRCGFKPVTLVLLGFVSAPYQEAAAAPATRPASVRPEVKARPEVESRSRPTLEQQRAAEGVRRTGLKFSTEPQLKDVRVQPGGLRSVFLDGPRSLRPPGSIAKRRDDPRASEYPRWVQTSLNQVANAGLKVDGRIGRATRDAVRAFQVSRGLPVNGEVGPLTERELSLAARTHPPTNCCESLFVPKPRRTSTPGELRPGRDPALLKDALHAEVTRSGAGELHVTASWGEAPEAGANDARWHDGVTLDSPEQLVAAARDRRVVFSGEAPPDEWVAALRDARITHVRVSKRSPKVEIEAHVKAAEALERVFSPDKSRTRIFDALPRGRTPEALHGELETLGLDPGEADAWRRYRDDIRAVEEEGKYRVDVATKAAVLEELRSGSADTILLVAHSQYGNLRLANDEQLTREELAMLKRAVASSGRPRAIVLYSCQAGEANALAPSTSELLLFDGVGDVFVAPATPVSAEAVPQALRRFIIGGERLRDAFSLPDPPLTRRTELSGRGGAGS